jgi:hypothetical protein
MVLDGLFVFAMKFDCYFSFDTKKGGRVEKGEKIKNHYIRIGMKKILLSALNLF